DDDTVRAELLPAIDRELVDRRGARHRRRGVLRDHVELALEVQVVPKHVAYCLRRRAGLRVRRDGNEPGNRDFRRKSARAGDGDRDLGLLRWRSGRRLGRRLLGRRLLRTQRNRAGQSTRKQDRFCHRLYWKTRWMVKWSSVNAAGRGGSRLVSVIAR